MDRHQFWDTVFHTCGISPSVQQSKKLELNQARHKRKRSIQKTIEYKKKRRVEQTEKMKIEMQKEREAQKKGETYRSGIGAEMLLQEANKKSIVCKYPGCGGNHRDSRSKDCKYKGVCPKVRKQMIESFLAQQNNMQTTSTNQNHQKTAEEVQEEHKNCGEDGEDDDDSIVDDVDDTVDRIEQLLDGKMELDDDDEDMNSDVEEGERVAVNPLFQDLEDSTACNAMD